MKLTLPQLNTDTVQIV